MDTTTLKLADALAAYQEKCTEYEETNARAKALKQECDAMEFELFERMDSEQVQSLNHAGLGVNFVRAETVYGQVQDRAEFIKWAEDESPELLERKERKKLVNELVRGRIDGGQELPPGLGFYVDRYISKRSG